MNREDHLSRGIAGLVQHDHEGREQGPRGDRGPAAGVDPLDVGGCGVWVFDASGLTTYLNATMSRLLNVDAAWAIGRPVLEAVHPEDGEQARRLLLDPRRGGEVVEYFVRRRGDEAGGGAGGGEWTLVSVGRAAASDGRAAGRGESAAVFLPVDRYKREQMRVRHSADERAAELTALNAQLVEEIEARRRAEAHLEESRRFAIATLDALDARIAILDEGGEVVAANAAWRDAAVAAPGTPLSCRVGEDLVERLKAHAEDEAQALRKLTQDLLAVLHTRAPRAERQVTFHEPAGERVFAARVTRFEIAGAAHAVLALQDATETVRARRELADSEARFRLLAENSTDWITRHRPDGRYLWCSPACRHLLGYEPGWLIGHDPFDYFHPDDVEPIRASHRRVLRSAETSTVEYRFRRADGSYVWLESTSRSVADPDTGEIIELQCASRDISPRRETESMLRLVQSAIDQVEDAVVITEPQLDPPGPRIVYVNRAFLAMTGYRRGEVIGQAPRILQGPRTDRSVLDRLRQRLAQGKSFSGQTTNYRKDGEPYVVEWAITPVRDRDGRVVNWVSIQRDITERLEAEAAARQRQNELAHVARLSTMGEMASGLAHELNQPLAAIANYTRGVLRRLEAGGGDRGELHDALDRVVAQADRAGEIIQRLRGFVRKREPQRTAIAVDELVRDVTTLLGHDLRQSEVEVDFDTEPGLPPVYVDPIQIEQVLLNLIRNAMDALASEASHQAAGEPRSVRLRCRRHDRRQVGIEVMDRGPGLTQAQLDHIFDPFFTTKDAGMGMGLTISQSLVEAHGGRLWAEPNDDGRGLTFHLLLPAA